MLRVTTIGTGPQGAPYYSTFYFGGTTEGEAAVAGDATQAFWTSFAGALRTDLLFQVQPEIELVDPATGNILGVFADSQVPIDCTGTGDPLPTSTQGLIRWRTGVYVAGKEIRGRTFIPGYTETSSTNGVPIGTTVSGLTSVGTALLSAGSAAGGMGVWSPTRGQWAPASSAAGWNQWAVMRSRRD